MPGPLITERKNIQMILPVKVKDANASQGIVCAYGSSFNIIDDNYPIQDVVKPSAFKKTITDNGPAGSNRILYCWDHKLDSMILGKPQVLREDEFGLYFESKIIRTSYGADILMLYEHEIINEHSIGYFVVKSSYGEYKGVKVRFLEELGLIEVSGVPLGMNPITPTLGLKDNQDAIGRLATQLQRAQGLLHTGHFQSDKIAPLLEKQTQEWELLLKAVQPPEPTHDHITTAHQYSTEEDSVMTLDYTKLARMVAAELQPALDTKGASGSTSVPLGERTEAWSGSEAHNAVVKLATKDDGSLDQTIMKNAHFWYDDSAPDKIGSYKLIYCTVTNGKLQAVWKGITGCAGALRGARGTGVDIPSGDEAAVKAKIEAWYAKAAKQYDDDTIEAPWVGEKAGGKRMRRKDYRYLLAHKDYRASVAAQMQQLQKDFQGTLAGLKEDLQDEWGDLCPALVTAIIRDLWNCRYPVGEQQPDAHKVIAEDLAQFTEAVLALVDKSVAAEFIPIADDDGDSFFDPDSDDDDDDECSPMMMSARLARAVKEGRPISAANHKALSEDHATMGKAMQDMQAAHKSMGKILGGLKPSTGPKDEGEADTSDESPDNANDAKGAKGATTGAGATPHTTGNTPAGAPAQTTPANDDMTAAFNNVLNGLRKFTGD